MAAAGGAGAGGSARVWYGVVGLTTPRIVDLGPEQWWNDAGERLRILVVSTVPSADEDGTVAWVTVSGWRLLPDGGRRWEERVFVRAGALRGGGDR